MPIVLAHPASVAWRRLPMSLPHGLQGRAGHNLTAKKESTPSRLPTSRKPRLPSHGQIVDADRWVSVAEVVRAHPRMAGNPPRNAFLRINVLGSHESSNVYSTAVIISSPLDDYCLCIVLDSSTVELSKLGIGDL